MLAFKCATILCLFLLSSSSWGQPHWRAKIFSVVVGQSNEQGVGRFPSVSELPAPLLKDPIPPNGGMRSWWPKLSTLLANRGVSFRLRNTAVGASSIARSWAGQIVPWRVRDVVAKGSLIDYDGFLWLCVNSDSSIRVTGAPPKAGKGDDGIEWRLLGPVPAQYRAMQVLREGDLGFDPNGYLRSAFDQFKYSEADEVRVAVVSIGQTDKTFRVTREQYLSALSSVVDYFVRRGVIVFVGFTSPIATAGYEWFDVHLVPAWGEFLEERSGDNYVVRGANLTLAFGGALPVSPSTGPGLQEDRIHLNDAAYDFAAAVWADAIVDWVDARNRK